jgi:isoleucyl-tRNA synthetase
MKVSGGNWTKRAVSRFADQICEELNLKRVTLHDDEQDEHLLKRKLKPNPKTLGPKCGSRLPDALKAMEEFYVTNGNMPSQLHLPGDFLLNIGVEDLKSETIPPTGWAGAEEGDTEVLVDCRITEELKREGMARDIVRQVQQLRKDADLQMEDRIALVLQTESAALQKAIQAHKDYIGNETLTVEWPANLGDAAEADVKIDGQALVIRLRKA